MCEFVVLRPASPLEGWGVAGTISMLLAGSRARSETWFTAVPGLLSGYLGATGVQMGKGV